MSGRPGYRDCRFPSQHPFKDSIQQRHAAAWCQASTNSQLLDAVILEKIVTSRHPILVIPHEGYILLVPRPVTTRAGRL